MSELARLPVTACGRTRVLLFVKKESDATCGHSQMEKNWPQHTTATQMLCRRVNFDSSSYYLGVNLTHNSDTSLTASTGVVPGRFNCTTRVPLAGHKPN